MERGDGPKTPSPRGVFGAPGCGHNEMESAGGHRPDRDCPHEGVAAMKRSITVAACLLVLVSASAAPAAAQSRKATGIVSLLAGAGLVIAAFDYQTDVCPEGYSRHTYQHQSTQCFYASPVPPFDTDVRDATIEATFTRPRLAWVGVGAVGLGVVLLTLPDNRVTRDLDIQVSPERVSVRRKFGW